jgi:stearoyl-CoA desaturase (delta-9 desaturase)
MTTPRTDRNGQSDSATSDKPSVTYGIQKSVSPRVLWLRVLIVYAGALAALAYYPLTQSLFWLCVASYSLRVWGSEVAYHRYFAHRAFRAGRVMQFIMGVIGCLAGQRGPLWWAAMHYVHHRNADTKDDPHSPVAHSFWHAQSGWFMQPENLDTNLDLVSYYSKFPELRFINKHYSALFFGSALPLFAAGHFGLLGPDVSGLAAVCWGAFLPTTLSVHIVSLVNSIGHRRQGLGGFRRYATSEESVNRPILALFTFGMGWHNNHHRYAAASRAGFAWYELDLGYYSLRLLALLGLVRDLRPVPPRILAEGHITTTDRMDADVA